jgi:SAM-dependent methyltransferase
LAPSSIYGRLPLLEVQWEGMRAGQASVLARSEAWYLERLRDVRGPICELACGFGRLLLPFARRRIPVHGSDASPERIAAARQLFTAEGLPDCEFEVCTLPAVPARRGFHAVMLALNAIGYLRDAHDKLTLFRNVAAMLVPGGSFVLDYRRGALAMRLLRVWPGLHGRVATDPGVRVRSHLAWDRRSRSIRETFVVRSPEGVRHEYRDHFVFSSVRETLRLLRAAGFTIERTCGGFSSALYRPWSPMIGIVARAS